MERVVDLKVPSSLWSVRRVARIFRELVADRVTADTAERFELALVETCTNAVRHGTSTVPGDEFRVTISADGQRLKAVVESAGRPFDFWGHGAPSFDLEDTQSLPTGGMGIALIKNLMDRVDYEPLDRLNRVTIEKVLDGSERLSDDESRAVEERLGPQRGLRPQERDELLLLQKIELTIEEDTDHESTVLRALDCVREFVPFTSCELWVHDPGSEEYRCLFSQNGGASRRNGATLEWNQPVEEELGACGPRVISDDEDAGPRLRPLLQRLLESFTAPVVVVPLLNRARTFGILVLQWEHGRDLDERARRLLSTARRQICLLLQIQLLMDDARLNEGLRREIDIARSIQHGLLPQETPAGDGFDLFAGCITAAKVGGDYYDFFATGTHEIGMLIADVSGHSVASGLVAMSFRSCFRHFLEEQSLRIPEIFTRANRSLERELHQTGHFLSAVFGTYDSERRSFRYVNAGHHPALVYTPATDTFRTLDEVGLLLGILPEWIYQAGEVRLSSGDLLVLFTDGIVEAENQNAEQFGVGRFKNAIRKYADHSAKRIYHYLLREMYVFQDEQFNQDDVTLIIMKVK